MDNNPPLRSHYLIVGLGNPGEKYNNTPHNLGFEVIKKFAERQGWVFKRDVRLQGKIASGSLSQKHIHLLFPTTYMNLSGLSVRKAVDYFKIPRDQLLVVVDDVYTKIGELRLRSKGSSGGHNGLKSIEYELQTQFFCRLRVGVGLQDEKDLPDGREHSLADYVLGKFSPSERIILEEVIQKSIQVISAWVCESYDKAAQLLKLLAESKKPSQVKSE